MAGVSLVAKVDLYRFGLLNKLKVKSEGVVNQVIFYKGFERSFYFVVSQE